MSKPVLPWSLKGVSPEAREIAKKAAAQQGITIGEWVSRAIRDVGPDQDPGAVPEIDGAPAGESLPATTAADGETMREAVRARIYDTEERIAHMVGPLQDIIEQLSRRLTRIEERAADDSPPAPPVERAAPRRLDGW
ncbi:hypothetical protein [Nisaea sp.]|uniref:hypothetical protein n=1 Tax=Nisaea sp. TaxID=2024842 RepID=UPI0032EBB0A5